jgi:hypothetical protein
VPTYPTNRGPPRISREEPLENTLGTNNTAHKTASQRVQRGTKRPSGKVRKKTLKATWPAYSRSFTGHQSDGKSPTRYCIVPVNVAPPKTSKVKEARSAIPSSERRKKITAAVAEKTAVPRVESPTVRPA